MPTPFSTEDLGRIFDARTLTRGRSLLMLGTVDVALDGDTIAITVDHLGQHRATMTPSTLGPRVIFRNACACGQANCAHLAAGALAALDRFPQLRRATQRSFLDTLTAADGGERTSLVFELAPAPPPAACKVSTLLVGERSGRLTPTTPAAIVADRASSETVRMMARMLGAGSETTATVAPDKVTSVLGLLARMGRARWHATGKPLKLGEERAFQANQPPNLPPKSGVILGDSGPWYVDGATGAVGRVRVRQAPPAPRAGPPGRPAAPARRAGAAGTTRAAARHCPARPRARPRRPAHPGHPGAGDPGIPAHPGAAPAPRRMPRRLRQDAADRRAGHRLRL